MVVVGAAGVRALWREQGREMLLLPIRQFITRRGLQMASQTQLATLCRRALAQLGTMARNRS